MDTIIKMAVLILISSNLLFTISIAIYTFFEKLGQRQYIISFSAFMTIVFIVTLLVQILMPFLKKAV
jgi:hypothetical protein